MLKLRKTKCTYTHTQLHCCALLAPSHFLYASNIRKFIFRSKAHAGRKVLWRREGKTKKKKEPTVSWLVTSRLDAFYGTRPKC